MKTKFLLITIWGYLIENHPKIPIYVSISITSLLTSRIADDAMANRQLKVNLFLSRA